jgi:hypothetical protein
VEKGNSTIGVINLLLIAFSFLISFLYPISTFILAYAILGPLHYLTQLNWLSKKEFFSKNGLLKYAILILSGMATLIYLAEFKSVVNIDWYLGRTFIASIVIIAVLVTIIGLSKSDLKKKVIFLAPVILIAFLLSSNTYYLIIIGVLFVSVIHVYLFTLLHMLSGFAKKRVTLDLVNSIVMIVVPIIIYFNPVSQYSPGEEYFSNNQFISGLANNISYLLGYRSDSISTVVFLKLVWFIAFAYLYHYLNWFSKTKIIHWDDGLTKKKTIVICSISLIFSCVYLLGFEIGLIATLFLSYLHVFAELPINYISIKNILHGILGK